MRFIPLLIAALALTGCDLATSMQAKERVDVANIAPLTGREQALIFGADGAMQQGNYAAAERDYLTAAAASTGHVDAHLALARLYEKQHASEKERDILVQALELQPNHALANYRMGKLHLEANQYSDALAAFQKGRLSRPEDVDLAIGEAVTQDMMGKHRAAQMIYQRIITQNPQAKLTNVRTNLGMSYLLSGDAEKAAELLKTEAKKPEASEVARHNLALAYGMLGKNTEAKTLLGDDMDEETRLLVLARLQAYLQERAENAGTPPIQPNIYDAQPSREALVGSTRKPADGMHKTKAKPAIKKKPGAAAVPIPAPIILTR